MVLPLYEALTIESIVGETSSLAKFNSLYNLEKFPSFYSIFAPDNAAFDLLHPVELSYLKTRFAKQDRTNLLNRHACDKVLYTKDLKLGGNVSSLEGGSLHYRLDKGDVLIGGVNITQRDIVARNGTILNT